MGLVSFTYLLITLSVASSLVCLLWNYIARTKSVTARLDHIAQVHTDRVKLEKNSEEKEDIIQRIIKNTGKVSGSQAEKRGPLQFLTQVNASILYLSVFINLSLGFVFYTFLVNSVLIVFTCVLCVFPLTIKLLVQRKNRKEEKLLIAQLPSALDLCVRALEAGMNVNSVFEVCSKELNYPISKEFEIITSDMRVGLSIEEALTRLTHRRALAEVQFFATLVIMQNKSGGGLSKGLKTLSASIRERQKLISKMQSMTSEPRTSMKVLVALPVVFGVASSFLNPEAMSNLIHTDEGRLYFWAMIGWGALGVFIMLNMTKIE